MIPEMPPRTRLPETRDMRLDTATEALVVLLARLRGIEAAALVARLVRAEAKRVAGIGS